ncbi:RNA cytidine acetyltransferase-like [Belonocnema kinseyi]|uniref:RNA cytidine acetyltransferase-like n=1 Tax=Belonocnema kinseyi TaxID=2817044 RepID=UPI00143DDCD9|nr:RNA cytidine acetyltransferase-like [Belonocnema kinseyi]
MTLEIDNRIQTVIENGVKTGHRTFFVIVGEKSKDQIMYLHHMLSKTEKSCPSILWCHKKELTFSSNRKKKMKSLQKKVKSGKLDVHEDDPFDLFILSAKIRYCPYKDSQKILGNTFGMCVLQDFEALTPNLLARTMETVEGGGIIAILLQSLNSLKQLYTMQMDVHQRLRTEAHQDVVCRFNERFLLSLASCARCLVIDDQFHVLPISMKNLKMNACVKTTLPENCTEPRELDALKKRHRDKPNFNLLECCKTLDQAKALLKFIETISEKTLRSTVSLTAARGRGKSATMGLAIAGAIAFGYSNIYVTSPSPENLNTLFEFVFKGLDILDYKEHTDYSIVQSRNPEYNRAIIRVNFFRNHRQTIQFINPPDAQNLQLAELLVIDEAAAIPLPLVKKMFGPYLIFLASTINGYEGTGRSLSLKLLQQLREQSRGADSKEKKKDGKGLDRSLEELTLEESIRYKPGDAIENWLSELLCLDNEKVQPSISTLPTRDECQLLYINRDTLFSFHKASEKFLQKLVALYVASHYKNTPNDLQMMSDAPAHHLFCLVKPIVENKLPEILVFIQVCLEGQLSKNVIQSKLGRGQKAAGDLIPWTIAEKFNDQNFPILSGARIVRIATHPEYQGQGYGTKAMELLKEYYSTRKNENLAMDESNGEKRPSKKLKTSSENEKRESKESVLQTELIEPRSSLPPLFMELSERPAEDLDYIGVSFGVTPQLIKFWKKVKFIPVYLRQTTNDITGEHTCIMIQKLKSEKKKGEGSWIESYWTKFRQRFIRLLSSSFKSYDASLALSILENNAIKIPATTLTRDRLAEHLDLHDIEELEKYSHNMTDYHVIIDLIQPLSQLYFLRKLGSLTGQENNSLQISAVQAAILLGLGLQHKMIDEIGIEFNLQSSQLLGLFNKAVRKFTSYLNALIKETRRDFMEH